MKDTKISAKRKRDIFDALMGILILIFGILGILQSREATYIFGLAAIALSGLSFYLSIFRPRYLSKPILNSEPNVQFSPPTQHEINNLGAKNSWFLRLKIVNSGLTPAKKCVGRLIEVRDSNDNQFDRFDPFHLYWSRQNNLNDFHPIDIQGNGDFYYLDIAQVKEAVRKNPIDLRIVAPGGRLVLDSNAREGSKLPSGIYHLLIAIYSGQDEFIKPTWFTIASETRFSAQRPPKIYLRD